MSSGTTNFKIYKDLCINITYFSLFKGSESITLDGGGGLNLITSNNYPSDNELPSNGGRYTIYTQDLFDKYKKRRIVFNADMENESNLNSTPLLGNPYEIRIRAFDGNTFFDVLPPYTFTNCGIYKIDFLFPPFPNDSILFAHIICKGIIPDPGNQVCITGIRIDFMH
jgi:hypothetical protein